VYALLVLPALILYWVMLLNQPAVAPTADIAYSEFQGLVRSDSVTAVELRGRQVTGALEQARPLGSQGQSVKRFRTRLPDFGGEDLLAVLDQHGVKVTVLPTEQENVLLRLLTLVLPWIILFGFFFWVYRRTSRMVGGAGPGGLGQFLREPAQVEAKVPKVTFDDVAGHRSAKQDVRELVDFLQAPERYRTLGAEVPHGVLLMGPPGTGKTLMARALAGEAGVPFFSISGSAFIEVFVGVGASRVRKLFEAAKAKAPSIIFIDELDSVGRTRGTGLGGGHDEREQTLNQILAEMDGFEPHEAVIVLAATNRPDVLDPALLRPGRFDRHVALDLPDRDDREAILRVHTRQIPLADDVSLPTLAAGTPGFSGADLRNLVNEAAMMAAREKAQNVTMDHFNECRDKLLLGAARTLAIQPAERHRLAVHEAGHTTVAFFLPNADPLYKVTIIPRGRSLGGTQQLPEQERHTLSEEYLRDRLAVMLGGRVAERLVVGTVSSGADDDIRQATALARAMVARWGMSPEVGPMDLRQSEEQPFLGKEIAQPRHFSEHSAEMVDNAVRALLQEAAAVAEELLTRNRRAFERLAKALEAHETLDRAGIARYLNERAENGEPSRGEAVASSRP